MSHLAHAGVLGLLPLRDHDTKTDIHTRTVLFGSTVSEREKDSGRFLLEEGTQGDVNCASHFKPADRSIPGWAFAWPVVVKDHAAEGEAGATSGKGGAVGRYLAPGGSVQAAAAGLMASSAAGGVIGSLVAGMAGLLNGSTLASAGKKAGYAGNYGQGATAAAYRIPDFEYGPVFGGPQYPGDTGFASKRQLGTDLPKSWPGFPKGYYGIGMAGSDHAKEQPVVLSGDPRLVAVNFAGDPTHSTTVVDCDWSRSIDDRRQAPLHSMMRVVLEPLGALPFGPRNPIAWNFKGGGQDDSPGFGMYYDDIEHIQSKDKGPTTTTETPRRGEVSPAAGAEYPGGGGTGNGGGGNVSLHFTLDPKSGHGAAAPVIIRAKSPQGIGIASRRGYGPLHVGSDKDKHELGSSRDGELINSGHIWTKAYFYAIGDRSAGDDYDAPLEFQQRPYPKPPRLPNISKVHLVMDMGEQHQHTTGTKNGLWRWYAEVPAIPAPTTPRRPTPTTPPAPPTSKPPPPGVPEPSDPPNKPPPVTTPGGSAGGAPYVDGRGGGGGGGGVGGDGGGGSGGPNGDPKGLAGAPQGSRVIKSVGAKMMLETGLFSTAHRPGAPLPMAGHFVPVVEPHPGAPFVRAREPQDPPQEHLAHLMEVSFPTLLGRPQNLSTSAYDTRRTTAPFASQQRAEEVRPVTGRIESWGGMRAGEWESTYRFGQGRYGFSGPGGFLVLPPEVDMSDAGASFAPSATRRSTTYFATGPGAYFGSGLPNLVTGGMKSAYRWGVASGALSFDSIDAAGAVTAGVFGANSSGRFVVKESGGASLAVGAIADGSLVRRVGTSLVGMATTSFESAGAVSTHEAAADPHTGYQKESEKDAAAGYAGLNAASRTTKGVIAADDVVVTDDTKGLVLKSPNLHYWRATIDDAGSVTWTDLGTSPP